MAKATLSTSYKDDVLASAMSGSRRYKMISNDDGTVSFQDATTYTQTGSTFGASVINTTNTAVNESADKANIIDSLSDVVANTTSGKMAGALAVKELNSKFINGVNWASAGGGITTGTVNLATYFENHGALLIVLSKDFNVILDTQIVPTPLIKSGKEYHLYGALSNAKLTVVASDERTLKITELTSGFAYNIYYVMSTSFSV